MSKGSKALKVIKGIIIGIVAVVLVAGIAGFVAVHFVIVPKYNETAHIEGKEKREITSGEVFKMAKYLTDQQLRENVINFDALAAKDVLAVMGELEKEFGEENNAPQKPEKKQEELVESLTENPKSAYERILAAADKDEIAAGLDIIAKLDMARINKLHSEGKTAELKSYVKSVLTSAEISTSLRLYNKYKHLL